MLMTGSGGKIHVLPGDVVSRIAAGEVVERPAAVVKELVENSLDANSHSITVEAKDGGLTLIRITDDGEGMSREDAPRAFERHATSKLRSDQDLWSIRTMGFRGEALPSIASVSHVRLATALRSADAGIEFQVKEGRVGKIVESPPVAGTSIEVAELFYNQPARKKFLKSVPTEFSHISRVVQQAALAWPSVHFRLIHNGTEVVNYPAALSVKDRISQVYRPLWLERCHSVEAHLPAARISGYVVDPVHAKASRIPQELFLNQRPVRNAAVFHAVAEGYGASLSKGVHPLFVLFLDVDPDRVDVNIHPAKRDVRFASPDLIHQLVRRAVRQALGSAEPASVMPGSAVQGSTVPHNLFKTPAGAVSSRLAEAHHADAGKVPSSVQSNVEPGAFPEAGAQLAFVSEAAESYVRVPSKEVVALGQLNRTFLVAQIGGGLAVVDQHTAHERVLFERLYRAWVAQGIRSQPLLLPQPVELLASQAALVCRYQDDLALLGLELEPFGVSAVLIRSVPTGLGKIDPEPFLHDVLEDLSRWDHATTVEMKVRPVLASLACHGAVRAGRLLALPEITALIEDWRAEGELTTCPHGRRTVFRLGLEDLEKMFGRVGW